MPDEQQLVPQSELTAALAAWDRSHDLAMHNFTVANKYEHQLRAVRQSCARLARQMAEAMPDNAQVKGWSEQLALLAKRERL